MIKIHLKNPEHYKPEEKLGICVVKKKDESNTELIKRFRKKYSKSGIAKEYRDSMYYEKPSIKRRKKRARAIRMLKKEEEKKKEMKERKQKMRRRRKNGRGNKRQSYS